MSTAAAVSSTVPPRWEVPPDDREERAVTHTVQPAAPSATATPRPIPRLAPVTHATLADMPGTVVTGYDRNQRVRAYRAGLVPSTRRKCRVRWAWS